MAYFALLDSNNIVTQLRVIANSECIDANNIEREEIGLAYFMKLYGGTWKQTSYNGTIRKNYAGIGYSYDETRDAFIPPRLFQAWALNESTCMWNPPIAYPLDSNVYRWDSDLTNWVVDSA